MPRAIFSTIAVALLLPGPMGVARAQQEVISEIHVHGNTLTSTDDILRVAGLTVGDPFTDEQLGQVTERLRATKNFERVDVLKRYASIDDPTRVSVVVLVDEGPVRIVPEDGPGKAARVMRRGRSNLMFMPVLSAEDGYGLTYGARFSFVDIVGRRSRVSFPLTWGGDKSAGVELEKDLRRPGAPRLTAGTLFQRRRHPFYREDADRGRVWARADWQLRRPLRVGTTAAWQDVSFLGDRVATPLGGADIVFDTRLDPTLPRNAVYARAAVEHLRLPDRPLTRTELEARGYIGVGGQRVLVLRGLREGVDRPAPPYYRWILGGHQNLRGFRAGTAVGDTLVAGSAELRAPISSPLRVAKAGVNIFVDTGVTYDKGRRLSDQSFKTGAGAGVWLAASVLQMHLEVAHGLDSGTRAHFGLGFAF